MIDAVPSPYHSHRGGVYKRPALSAGYEPMYKTVPRGNLPMRNGQATPIPPGGN